MKGGAPTPFNYEGTVLTIDNPFTHIAINRGDDNKFNFNILGKKGTFGFGSTPDVVFNNFCELFQYYKKNSPISCVHQKFLNNAGKTAISPSLVDILGLSLVLISIRNSYQKSINITNKFLEEAFLMLFLMVSGLAPNTDICETPAGSESMYINQFLREKLLTLTQKTIPSYDIQYITTIPINNLDEYDIRSVLTYFKQALFFYKYGPSIVPPREITFANMGTPEAAQRVLELKFDETAVAQFNQNKTKPSFAVKSNFYTDASLQSALSGSDVLSRQAMGGDGPKRMQRTRRTRRTRKTRRTNRKH